MALGPKYIVLLGLGGLLAFVLTLIVVLRGRGPMAGAALVFIVPIPFFIGLYGAVDGAIASYTIIANSVLQPKPSEIAQGFSLALATPLVGMLLMAPSYALAMFGLMARSLADGSGGQTK
jgi:hypothetical protein